MWKIQQATWNLMFIGIACSSFITYYYYNMYEKKRNISFTYPSFCTCILPGKKTIQKEERRRLTNKISIYTFHKTFALLYVMCFILFAHSLFLFLFCGHYAMNICVFISRSLINNSNNIDLMCVCV